MAKSNEIIGPVLRRPAAMAFTGLSFIQFDELVGGSSSLSLSRRNLMILMTAHKLPEVGIS